MTESEVEGTTWPVGKKHFMAVGAVVFPQTEPFKLCGNRTAIVRRAKLGTDGELESDRTDIDVPVYVTVVVGTVDELVAYFRDSLVKGLADLYDHDKGDPKLMDRHRASDRFIADQSLSGELHGSIGSAGVAVRSRVSQLEEDVAGLKAEIARLKSGK